MGDCDQGTKTHKTAAGTGEERSGRATLKSAWDAPVNSPNFKKENKIPAQGFLQSSTCLCLCFCMFTVSRTFGQPHGSTEIPIINTEVTEENSSVFNSQFVSRHSRGHKHQPPNTLQLIQTHWIPFWLWEGMEACGQSFLLLDSLLLTCH